MPIGIVHLSDIHLRTKSDFVLSRGDAIKKAIQALAYDITDILLVVTGDVAYSGKVAEYTIAKGFVNSLEQALKQLPGVRFLSTITIPGNHDCDFDTEGSVRPALIASISTPPDGQLTVPDDKVSEILTVQNSYHAFEDLVSGEMSSNTYLYRYKELEASSGKIVVRCFNTAWLSRKKENIGQLYFPIGNVPNGIPNGSLVISLFHHPYNWLEPINSRAFRRFVETTTDIVMTGHEHDGESYSKTNASGSTTSYVEGAALQANGIETGFNYIKIDQIAQTYQVHLLRWKENMYIAEIVNSAMFTRNQALLEHNYVNTSEFRRKLQEIGTPYSHSIKAELLLRDLFVYPDLRVTNLDSPGSKDKIINSDDVLTYVCTKKKVSIGGSASSGKTSLAKVLYEDLAHLKGLVPLLLDFEAFRGANPSKVMTGISRAFENQYSTQHVPHLYERYTQLDPDSRVLIVDDWHRIKLSAKGVSQVLEALHKFFGRIVLITDDVSVFRQFSEAESFEGFAEFEHCEIKQFGYRLRGELVCRWHKLGRELEVEEMELTHDIAASENLLDTLIGRGVVPSFPFFVFSALQASNSALGQNYGSYGHIYESLLVGRLARSNKKSIGQKFTYLSILAYHCFVTNKGSLQDTELKTLHKKYEKEYGVPLDQNKIIKELLESQILARSYAGSTFQYKYAYYFFIAKYFQDGIQNVNESEALTNRLREMANTAYDEESSNILIFYLYLTKDRSLIQYILANAKKTFSRKEGCDFEKDFAFVNGLYSTTPTLTAPSAETEKNREEHLRRRDEAEDTTNPEATEDSAESREVDLAFSNLEIMGQVLRNFPLDLRVDIKLDLTRESYQLGLRALNGFLDIMRGQFDALRQHVVKRLKEHKSFIRKDIKEVNKTADRMLVALVEVVAFGMVKKISFSVGLEELRETYEIIRTEAGEDDVPTRMLHLAIALDHFGSIPEHDVRDLEHRVRGNILSSTILRTLIAEHLSLFPCPFKIRASMSQLFNFRPTASLLGAKKVKQLTDGVH